MMVVLSGKSMVPDLALRWAVTRAQESVRPSSELAWMGARRALTTEPGLVALWVPATVYATATMWACSLLELPRMDWIPQIRMWLARSREAKRGWSSAVGSV